MTTIAGEAAAYEEQFVRARRESTHQQIDRIVAQLPRPFIDSDPGHVEDVNERLDWVERQLALAELRQRMKASGRYSF